MANPQKRRATIISKYGTWDAYLEYWKNKRKATLIAKLGEEGYLEYLHKASTKGGKKSRRPKGSKKTNEKTEDNAPQGDGTS